MGSAEEIADAYDILLSELVDKAGVMITRCSAGLTWPYKANDLEACLRTAMTEAIRDPRSSDEFLVYYLAAHAACRLIRHTEVIFRDGIPNSSEELISTGASCFMTGWATQVAVFIVNNFTAESVSEDEDEPISVDHPRVRTLAFAGVLDELAINCTAEVHHRIVPDLVRCIDGVPSQEPDAITALLPESVPPQPAATTEAPRTVASDRPGGDAGSISPPRSPTPPPAPASPAPAGEAPFTTPPTPMPVQQPTSVPLPVEPLVKKTRPTTPPWMSSPVVVTLTALLVLGSVAVAAHQVGWSSATSTPATTTTTATAPTTANADIPSPTGPELAFSAPTLDHVALRLYAYPDGSSLSERVKAVPEHPTQARAVVGTGQSLSVEIHLSARPGVPLDPMESFSIGLRTSGLLTLDPGSSSILEPGAPPPGRLLPRDLVPTPTTEIPLDPNGGVTVYTVRFNADAQPAVANSDAAFFCGFNTEYVAAIIRSSKYSDVDVITTLPVSVLRAGSNCAK